MPVTTGRRAETPAPLQIHFTRLPYPNHDPLVLWIRSRYRICVVSIQEQRMAKVTYIEYSGTSHVVEVANGLSVMEGAIKNNVPGIDADCGGACSCATCHVYVDENWVGKLTPADETELAMIDYAVDQRENSRLSCQIKITAELDGLIITLPVSQN